MCFTIGDGGVAVYSRAPGLCARPIMSLRAPAIGSDKRTLSDEIAAWEHDPQCQSGQSQPGAPLHAATP
jgi:hypothetical protein